MTQLLEQKIIILPPIKTPNPNKPLPLNFRLNAYCHYHEKNGHNTQHCKHLKPLVQDLIDSSWLLVGGVNEKGNKSVASPNQNMQILTNPMLNHNISFVKASQTTKNDVMNVYIDDGNMDTDKKAPIDTIEQNLSMVWLRWLKHNIVRAELRSLLTLVSHLKTLEMYLMVLFT